ncbi:MAG: hypothetical protein A2020_02555 [Lentisphaerae bacterium GWF2_45_14]|nr:MAG: hypothetical protein A2020_02555 [Lentisphaerae bacterium GWF2_45_14]
MSRFLTFTAAVFLCNYLVAVDSLDKLVQEKKSGTVEIAPGNYEVDELSIPETITLKIDNGAVINVKKKLEINGVLEAGIYKIFEGPGQVAGKVKTVNVYPQWFGAAGDGKNDDSDAIQKAADFAQFSFGGLLFIPPGRYLFSSDIKIRCDIECKGLLIKEIEVDESKTSFSYASFCKSHFLKNVSQISFVPDTEKLELSPDAFYGIKENDFKLPSFKAIPLANGSGTVDLEEGGTLTFSSTDFFSSRQCNNGDEFYDKNDCTQLVSPAGDVFPEFCFSYGKVPETEVWSAESIYKKGDYCKFNGETYKATWPSGKDAIFTNPYKGTVKVGPVSPDGKSQTISYKFKYSDGSEDKLTIWRKVGMKVAYSPPQRSLTVNGLAVEIYLKNDNGQNKRIWQDSTVSVKRSGITFNNMRISCKSRNATLDSLCRVSSCANVTFNNGYFSGATNHGTGYNIIHSNCANITYNNCISTNCRDAMAGRHGKNITVNGGFYNRIDDHYGKNYTIRNVEINALSTFIPGYRTPKADMEKWGFQPEPAFAFGGGNIFIENCRIYNCLILFVARGDIGDLYGTITLKDIVIESGGDVTVFAHGISDKFDYAHKIRVPDRIIIENVFVNSPWKLKISVDGFNGIPYGQFYLRNCDQTGGVKQN